MTTGQQACIRPFRPGDGPRLAHVWSAAAPQDPISYQRLRDLFLLDRNFDPAGLQVAEQDGQLVGAALAIRRLIPESGDDLATGTGWVPFFVVDPGHQGQGLGRRLLGTVMEWLGELGRTVVIFSAYTPNYFLPGLDADRYPEAGRLLDSMGFGTHYHCVAMERSLRNYQIPPDVTELTAQRRAQGYRFAHPTGDEMAGLIQIAGEGFNPDWARAMREAVVAGMPLDRIIGAWAADGAPLGWAMFGTYERIIDRFGPFGVLPSSRGLGLGKALLHLSLEQMAAVGAHHAWFLWTDTESAAGRLYLGAGFSVTREFTVLRAELSGQTLQSA